MPIVDTDKVPIRYDYKKELPKDRYTLRCLEETFEISKNSGNPMLKRKWEIAAPETVTIDGQPILVAGVVNITQYCVTGNVADPSKNANCVSRLKEEAAALGLPFPAQFDTDNPPLLMKGVIADVVLRSEGRERMKRLTDEEKAAGVEPTIETDEEGNPVISYQISIGKVLGPGKIEI